MADLMRSDPDLPNDCLRLHAITGGGPAKNPEFAPISFFNVFPSRFVAECNGLFSETLVTVKEFMQLIKRADISQAFDQRKETDVIVTSRGAVDDDHDLYTTLLKGMGVTLEEIKARRWVGNVQYRPYTAEGAAMERPNDLRAVTLFELSDFVEMAQRRGKHVVLIARSCSICHNPQAEALLPLLTVPELKVWSHLVMDVSVAQALLSEGTVGSDEAAI
jgi:DNA-binding transcriptional regulator LsrR (DeoR family)